MQTVTVHAWVIAIAFLAGFGFNALLDRVIGLFRPVDPEERISRAEEGVADLYDRFKEIRSDRDRWKKRAESLINRA